MNSQRYRALDVLRGLAIIGTLGTNIWIFTNPYGFVGYLSAPVPPDVPAGWAAVATVLQTLAQGKFLGLLTLMFGIGLEIQRRSALRRGRRWPGRYPWRAALLFLDGLLHYLLVVEFDVLMGYAVTSVVVAYLLLTSERAQRRWMIITGSVHLLAITALTAVLIMLPGTGGSYPPGPTNPYADGSWWDLVQLRIENLALFRLEPVLISGYSIFMFLLGAKLLRAGVLDPAGTALRRRLMIIGGLGFVADFAIQTFGGAAGTLFGRYTTAALVSVGLLAAVTELILRQRSSGPASYRMERIGRMALSCYVMQNVIASILCYGWGFGLATRLPASWWVPGTMIIFAVTVLLIATFADLWLRRFSRGPVELAWTWCFAKINTILGPEPVREEVQART
jgi:uncharacterized protein